MTQQFPLLFAPFRLGKHDLQSRIVVTGHAAQFYDKQKLPTEDYAYYLRERAKGGAGMVTLGACAVHPTGTPTITLTRTRGLSRATSSLPTRSTSSRCRSWPS